MSTVASDEDLRRAYQSLVSQRGSDGHGGIYVFAGVKTGAGTSYIARNMAMLASETVADDRQVLIMDMDLQNNSQSTFFTAPENQTNFSAPQGPYDATFGAVPFWRVTPSAVNEHGQSASDHSFMSLHMVSPIGGGAPISFSQFHWDYFRPGQTVHIVNASPYWQMLRTHFAAIFIDVPALDRADVLSAVSMDANATVLVASSADAQDQAVADGYERVRSLGANCAGVILNDVPYSAPAPTPDFAS